MTRFHVERPEIDPPEPGEGPWGMIGRLIVVVACLCGSLYAMVYWK